MKEQLRKGHLQRSLGPVALTFYGVGTILGAGIYSVIGPAAGVAGKNLWMSFVLSSILALITGLSYVTLARRFPNAGAEYAYLKQTFPKRGILSFSVGLLVAFAGAGTAATVALSFVGYLKNFYDVPDFFIALALLCVLTLVNIVGVSFSSRVNIAFTLIEIVGLIIVIVFGLQAPKFFQADLANVEFSGIFSAASLIFFSYLGFEGIVSLAEESVNASRDLPRAIISSIVVTTLLYILVGLAATALLSPSELSESSSPLTSAVMTQSTKAANALNWIALFATANTALISNLAASRILFSMARDSEIPKSLASVLSKRGSPWISAFVILAASVGLLFLGKVEAVASVTSLCSLLAFMWVHVAVIKLRKGDEARGQSLFKEKVALILPGAGVLLTVLTMLQFPITTYLTMGTVIAIVLICYAIKRMQEPNSAK